VLVRAPVDIVDLRPLDVHAAREDGVRPLEVGGRRAAHVLVDETDLPVLGQVFRDHQDALGRHERLDAHDRIGVLERPEGRR
jgi:hypothetical protein